jgi:hypothetical protein
MHLVAALVGLALIGLILLEGFEAMVLPRRVTRPYRLNRLFYRHTWNLWRGVGRLLRSARRRESFLSMFGPLSLFALFAIWVTGLAVGFALLYWSLGALATADAEPPFSTYLYLSGVTLFTLGYGDVVPQTTASRFLSVVEAGLGFGFMAVIIGYLPVLYQAFSRRETTIALLDARAGSPPTAAQVLLRLAQARHVGAVEPLLAEWERWAAEVLECHLSFPVLSFYRSQHDNQSWLGALTVILDTCAFLIVGVKGADAYQAQLTFAMARHVVVDLALVFSIPPWQPDTNRLPEETLQRLREQLCAAGLEIFEGAALNKKLAGLRRMYEPFVVSLAWYFQMAVPPIVPEKATVDNWQTSAWMRRTPGIGGLPVAGDEHFD